MITTPNQVAALSKFQSVMPTTTPITETAISTPKGQSAAITQLNPRSENGSEEGSALSDC